MGTYSIDFDCFIGNAIVCWWKHFKKERSREIQIWTLAASVKIQFLESLFPQRIAIGINSSSIDQRMVRRNRFGSWHGRIGLSRIHIRQAPNRIWKLRFQRLPKESWWFFRPNSIERSISWRNLKTKDKASNANGRANNVSNNFVLEREWDSGAHGGLEWFA